MKSSVRAVCALLLGAGFTGHALAQDDVVDKVNDCKYSKHDAFAIDACNYILKNVHCAS